jgi:hypothetical protein
VSDNWSNKFWAGRTAHIIIRSGLLAGVALAACGMVRALDTSTPATSIENKPLEATAG